MIAARNRVAGPSSTVARCSMEWLGSAQRRKGASRLASRRHSRPASSRRPGQVVARSGLFRSRESDIIRRRALPGSGSDDGAPRRQRCPRPAGRPLRRRQDRVFGNSAPALGSGPSPGSPIIRDRPPPGLGSAETPADKRCACISTAGRTVTPPDLHAGMSARAVSRHIS